MVPSVTHGELVDGSRNCRQQPPAPFLYEYSESRECITEQVTAVPVPPICSQPYATEGVGMAAGWSSI